MSITRNRLIGAVALLIPCALFLVGVALEIAGRRRQHYDERIFIDVAHQIVTLGLPIRTHDVPSPELFFDHTPLYVYALAVVSAVGMDPLVIGRSISVIFGLGVIAVAFLIARRVHGPVAGFVAALLIAVNPFFIELSWFVRMEVPLCFFLVLALWAIDRDRFVLAGIAIATAVMLKEIALAFWIVAVAYVLLRRGLRAVVPIAVLSPLAFGIWMAYAAWIDVEQFARTMLRWSNSAGGDLNDPRMRVGRLAWARAIVREIVGVPMVAAMAAAAPLAAMWRRNIPSVAWVPIAYVVLATATSFLIRLKEPRYLIAVIPMTAIAVALVVDWDRVIAEIRSPSDRREA